MAIGKEGIIIRQCSHGTVSADTHPGQSDKLLLRQSSLLEKLSTDKAVRV